MMIIYLGHDTGKTNYTFYSDILLLNVMCLTVLSFTQLEEAERKRIEGLKEQERQKVAKELELWRRQQNNVEKQKRVQNEGELHEEGEQLKEKKREKINKARIPNEEISKTKLKDTKGCVIEIYFNMLQSVGITLFLDVSGSFFIFVSTVLNSFFFFLVCSYICVFIFLQFIELKCVSS